MLNENDIQKLLRLKSHEQPPTGYYEKFLQDFHRRQRVEMLRQPAWKIALERMGAFFSEGSMGRLAYGTATAAVLLFAGVASYHMLNDGGVSSPLAANPVSISSQPVAEISSLNIKGEVEPAVASLPPRSTAQIAGPHYVIDSRPVSYERSFSF